MFQGIGPEGTLEAARPIVRSALMQSLHYNELDAPWYIYRKDHSIPQWPRAAYYFAAIFILGSVARYEPELLLGQNGIHATDTGWMLSRVLDCAERSFHKSCSVMRRAASSISNGINSYESRTRGLRGHLKSLSRVGSRRLFRNCWPTGLLRRQFDERNPVGALLPYRDTIWR